MLKSNTSGKQLHTDKPTVWVTHRWPETVENALCEEFNVILNRKDQAMTSLDMTTALQVADAVMLSDAEAFDLNALGLSQPRAKIIASVGSDFSHIDINVANQHGVTVTNTPDKLPVHHNDDVNLAITLIGMVSQRFNRLRLDQSDNTADIWSDISTDWCSPQLLINELHGKTLGIIGFQKIGQEVAKRAYQEFGMRIIAHDPLPISEEILTSSSATTTSIDELLQNSDYVLLNDTDQTIDSVTANDNDCYLIDAHHLNLMKPTAYLINIAQGAVVDPHALKQALWFETIGGVGLCAEENTLNLKSHEYPYNQLELGSCENAVMLPREQSTSHETHEAMGLRVTQNIKDFFAGNQPQDLVLSI